MTYIIVLNWNGFVATVDCVESLLRLRNCSYRIILCDNCSTDGSFEKLSKYLAENEEVKSSGGMQILHAGSLDSEVQDVLVTLVQTGTNLGYAGGNNVGIRLALRMPQKCGGVWIVNNDVVVDSDALSQLERHSNEVGHTSILGSVLLEFGTADEVQMAGGRLFRLLGLPKKIRKSSRLSMLPQALEADYVSGASLFIPRELLDIIGLMDERYFLYWEEADLCFRARLMTGRKCFCVTRSLVWHRDGATASRQARLQQGLDSINMVRFYKRFCPFSLLFALSVKPIVNQMFLLKNSQLDLSRVCKDYFWQFMGLICDDKIDSFIFYSNYSQKLKLDMRASK